MPKKQSGKKGKQSNFAKLSIFQPNKYKFKKACPLSVNGAPKVDYKNIKLLKNSKVVITDISDLAIKTAKEKFKQINFNIDARFAPTGESVEEYKDARFILSP